MTATLIQSPESPNRVVLKHISWQTYQSLIFEFISIDWRKQSS
jgi:hypothetical protein